MSKNTIINAYNCYDDLLGAFDFHHQDGFVVSGSLYILVENTKHSTRTTRYYTSEDYPRFEVTDPTTIGWFIRQRRLGDAAPAWLLEMVNSGTTMVGQGVGLNSMRDKCTCGTSRSPAGGIHLDYCDNFAGRGCAGITDAAKKRCSCCV